MTNNGRGAGDPGLIPMLLAVTVMAVWGTNFVVIAFGLQTLPPLLFAALRFAIAFFPLALFLPKPEVPLWNLASFGLLIGVGQFGILFIAMRADISPGLASLVVQTQVFFTIGFAVLVAGEKVRMMQWAAMALAVAGLAIIAVNTNGSATPLGLALVLAAALAWAAGNMLVRSAGKVPMLRYMVWSSLFPAPVLFALSLMLEGWPAIVQGVEASVPATWLAVLWQSVGNTIFGYSAWGYLLGRYSAASVAPFALLVPIFGLGASALFYGEALPVWKLAGAGLIIVALAIGLVRMPRARRAGEPA